MRALMGNRGFWIMESGVSVCGVCVHVCMCMCICVCMSVYEGGVAGA